MRTINPHDRIKLIEDYGVMRILWKSIMRNASTVAVAAGVLANSTLAADEARIKIASSSHRENGCSESAASFEAVIPNFEKLDKGFQGTVNLTRR
jgi:hypothetical protein